MSDAAVIRYLLSHNDPLLAVVPATRIVAGALLPGATLPAVSVKHVSGLRRQTADGAQRKFAWGRVQITVHTKDYVTQKSLIKLVRAALPKTRGTVNGVAVDSVYHELDGPDLYDFTTNICTESVDYIVTFSE